MYSVPSNYHSAECAASHENAHILLAIAPQETDVFVSPKVP